MNKNTRILISDSIKISILGMPKILAEWAKSHLCEPRKIRLSIDPEGENYSFYWLVTDRTGSKDSSYRVAYDEKTGMFGLVCTRDNGLEWYMGANGTFKEAIENM